MEGSELKETTDSTRTPPAVCSELRAERGRREEWPVLFARLQLKTGARRPIADAYDDLGGIGSVLRQAERIDNAIERISSLRSKDPAYKRFRDQARYCIPLD